MTKLDWNIGRVGEGNDALITGAVKDVASLTNRTAAQLMNTVSPSALAAIDNTATLISSPKKTLGTGENYKKLATTIPAVPLDVAMKSVRIPFSRIDDILNYGINNNLERWVAWIKAVTTKLIANLITNNGQRQNSFVNALGGMVEWFWDLVGTVAKAPTGILAKITGGIDRFLSKGTNWTQEFVDSVRIQDKHFVEMNPPAINSDDAPQAANDNRPPSSLVAGNDNSQSTYSQAA